MGATPLARAIFMADYSQEIEHLEAILNGAVESVGVDGLNTKIDLEQARNRLKELRALDDSSTALVRPVVTRIKLGGAW